MDGFNSNWILCILGALNSKINLQQKFEWFFKVKRGKNGWKERKCIGTLGLVVLGGGGGRINLMIFPEKYLDFQTPVQGSIKIVQHCK